MTANEIFTEAKSRFHYLSDQANFGSVEHWASLPELQGRLNKDGSFQGDCDDFAGWCVGMLRASNLPARYVLCLTERDECHCVAESDGLIFDNRQNFLTSADRLPYSWVSISGYRPGDSWHRILQ